MNKMQELQEKAADQWKKTFPRTAERSAAPFASTNWRITDACDGVDIYSSEKISNFKSTSKSNSAPLLLEGLNLQMLSYAAILGLGFVVLGINDVADHAPQRYQHYVLTGKLEAGSLLVCLFIVLFLMMQNKLRQISINVNKNIPNKQYVHVKVATYMAASPVEIAKVIQDSQRHWSLSGDLGLFKTLTQARTGAMMLEQRYHNRATQEGQQTYSISLDSELGLHRDQVKVEKYFVCTQVQGESLNAHPSIKEFVALKNHMQNMHKQSPFSFETMFDNKSYYEPKTNQFREKRDVSQSVLDPAKTSFLQGPRLSAQQQKQKARKIKKAQELELAPCEESSFLNMEKVPTDRGEAQTQIQLSNGNEIGSQIEAIQEMQQEINTKEDQKAL